MDLTAKCLVARPEITDPLFKQSVIFIYEHTSRGTAGVILNKPLTNTNSRELCLHRGYDAPVPREPIYSGGPVNTRGIVMLHTGDWNASNTLLVNDTFSVTSDDMMLYRYTQGDTARYYRFYAGVSVWHPQQIVMEQKRNQWLTADLDCATIFETDTRDLWEVAVGHSAQATMDRFI